MKTALNIVGIIAAMIITIFISTAGRPYERDQIKALQSEVRSLRLYMEVMEEDAKLTSNLVDLHHRTMESNIRITSNMMVAVKMLADQATPLKPTARSR